MTSIETLNVNISFHHERMSQLKGILDHFMSVFKLQSPPFVIGLPSSSSSKKVKEKVNINKNVNVAILDASFLSRVGFFMVYWHKFGYYPVSKTDLSGALVSPPPPMLGELELALWNDIERENGFIHCTLVKYMFLKMEPSHDNVYHIITRVVTSTEDTRRYPTAIYLSNDGTSIYDIQSNKSLDDVTLFYEDYSYYHGGIYMDETFGPVRHGKGFFHDLTSKMEIEGLFFFNELVKSNKKTKLIY
jgi:hypothetical protein